MLMLDTNTAPQYAQKIIDEEIHRLQMLVLRLKTLRNSYAYISKLPAELLAKIFMSLEYKSLKGCLLVSQHWRHVAVGEPMLWTEPPTKHHDLTLMMLERSKMADLIIHLDHNVASEATTAAILEHLGRIRELDITQPHHQVDATLKAVFASDQRASRLEKLHILSYADYDDSDDSDDSDTPPPLLPLQQYPISIKLLHSLQISGIRLDWMSLPAPRMTCLILMDVELVAKISPRHLLDTLREMPLLERLEMQSFNMLLDTEAQTTRSLIAIRLDHLYTLDDMCSAGQIQYFLAHVTLPSLQFLTIRFCHIKNTTDYSGAFAEISSSIKFGNFGALPVLKVTDTAVKLSALHMAQYHLSHNYVKIHIPAPWNTHITESVMKQLLTGISCINLIEAANFISDTAYEDEFLALFPSSLPDLQSLELGDRFHDSLKIRHDHPPTMSVSFPRLESVNWHSRTFFETERLRDLLMMRCEYYTPIQKLTFVDCDLSEWEVALLREIVVDVTVE